MKVIVAKTAGFCFGVKRAVDKVYQQINDSNGEKIYSYYEYYQFKRMKFKCEVSNIKYDDVSGRISYMEFTATGEIE